MISVSRVKEGSIVTDPDGVIYKVINHPQHFDYGDHELDVEVSRIARCERLSDKKIFRFKPNRQVILLEGEQLW